MIIERLPAGFYTEGAPEMHSWPDASENASEVAALVSQ